MVVLVGNPNVGKSVIFGYLSGKYVTVSNFPGTTVEISRGTLSANGTKDTIIDTPGVNNLLPSSEDEQVTRDLLLRENPKSVVQIVDSKNLKRGLLLTIQLAELDQPMIMDLNMTDDALFLGRPTYCPHGRKIPRGECCKGFKTEVTQVVVPLDRVEVGTTSKIMFTTPAYHERYERLTLLGVEPGAEIKLYQKIPSFVVKVNQTEVALDRDVAQEIFVRPSSGK